MVPESQQIGVMVKLHDDQKRISDELIKSLLTGNNSKYEAEWLLSHFTAWRVSNRIKDNMMQSIEYMRQLDEINYENVIEVGNKIKLLMGEVDLVGKDNENSWLDFDEIDDHVYDVKVNKVKSGWATLDEVLDEGWGRASLNVVMAQTSGGKSMMMCNMASRMVDNGYNCLYVSLEMPKIEVMHRTSCMRLKIPSKQYNVLSKDKVFMKDRINRLRSQNGGVFETKVGKLIIEKFETGNCTITDLDALIIKIEQVTGMKLDSICVDYLNLMSLERGLNFNESMLFLKGKHIAEGLRYIADKHNLVVITATQSDKQVWGSSDISLQNIPESKAVAETADTVWGIIRNPLQVKANKYRMKFLKYRNGICKNQLIGFDFHPEFLTLDNDIFIVENSK